MNEKEILNIGTGSPGETARVMTNEFLKLKSNYGNDYPLIFNKILSARALIYRSMGFTILDKDLIDKIVIESNGNFPFVILTDIYVTNKIQGITHSRAMLQFLNIIIEVVLENYNILVSNTDKYQDSSDLQIKILEFIGTESKVFGINESNKNNQLSLDSLYVSQHDVYASCLKFFKDGIVISASINGDVINTISAQNNINKWFNKSYMDCRGYYKLENNKISFSTFSTDGEVSYNGNVSLGSLDLTFLSKINSFSSKEIYKKT